MAEQANKLQQYQQQALEHANMQNAGHNQMAELQQPYNANVQKMSEYEQIITNLQETQNQLSQDAHAWRTERDKAVNACHECAQNAEKTVNHLQVESTKNALEANETIRKLEQNLKITTANLETLEHHLQDVKACHAQREKEVRAHHERQNEESYQYYAKMANEGADKIKSDMYA